MSLPYIGISLINKNKDEVLNVLQGISRYINTIYVNKILLEKEGIEFLIFLNKRYPKKKIILDLSDVENIDENFLKIIKKSKINEFVLSLKMPRDNLNKAIKILKENRKEIILKGIKFDIDFLIENQIKKIFFYKNSESIKLKFWNENQIKKINELIDKKFYVIVGDVVEEVINEFDEVFVQEITIGKEVCYSFNPIKTCKNICLLLKEIFLE